MFRISALTSFIVLLAACEPATLSTASAPVSRDATCGGALQQRCTFVNGPVRLQRNQPTRLPSRKATFYPMAAQLDFLDAGAVKWEAPKGTLTDGASIPPVFVPVIGAPTSRQFAQAAAMHDAYCGVGNEAGPKYHSRPWPQVHRMFYDALRVGGTPEKKAKLMYAAVYLAGPRWDDWRADPNDLGPDTLRSILDRVGRVIEDTNPSVTDLSRAIDRELSQAFAVKSLLSTPVADGDHGGYGSGGVDPTDPTDPGDVTGPIGPSDPADPGTPPGDPSTI
jgi:hypothetical protein